MRKEKNICLTINSLAPGGAEKQCLLLAKALRPYHDVLIVIMKPQPVYKRHLSLIEKEKLSHVFLSRNPVRRAYQFIRLLKRYKFDMIFSYLPADTVWAAICGRMAGVPFIFGGIRSSHLPWFKYSVIRLIHNNLLSYTIANSFSAQKSAIEFGFNKKVLVVPNGISIRSISHTTEQDRKKITIISVGRLVKSKAYDTALKSIVELKTMIGKEDYQIRLKIVGEGPEKENIIAATEEYNVQNEVEVITDTSDVYPLLESSDIYLSTSILEGISNAIMEAMNCALPAVVSDAGDNRSLIIHGKTGFITEFHDYKKIAAHLYHLIKSPTIRKQMGLKGYEHLIENFSYEAFQKKYLDIISNVKNIEIQNGEFLRKEKMPG